jgi:hypothetical protein
MKRYAMYVFSHPIPGREEEYLDWYQGQHIHDLLSIPGIIGCKFYKTCSEQLIDNVDDDRFPYLMVWEFETDDLDSLLEEIRQRKKDGRSLVCPAFESQLNYICTPLSHDIQASDVVGKSVEEVRALYEEKRVNSNE